jgi:uncharacterized membrane protein YqjE
MWAEYRNKFIFTQIAILGMLMVLRFGQHYPWPAMGFAFLVLQFFGIMGIRWSVRMKRKLLAERPMLRPRD